MFTIPSQFREFSVWLNPRNLRSFRLIEIARLARKILKEKVPKLDEGIQRELSSGLTNTPEDAGSYALRLYFFQLLMGKSFSLDLRQSSFSFHQCWQFNAEHLAFTFSQNFLSGIVDIYHSYYLKPGAPLLPSLQKLGLVGKNWSLEECQEFEQLFLHHFSQATYQRQKFQMSELLHSFSIIFKYVSDRGGKIPSEFAIFGVYLTSLYFHLESTKSSYDVREAFRFAYNQHQRVISHA